MKIPTFEEHGEVLSHWISSGWKNEITIIFDRHFDFKRLTRKNSERILNVVKSGQDISALNRDISFRNDARFAYGLDDFLFPAMELKLIERLIWVYPSPRPLSDKELFDLLWKQFERIPGFGASILENIACSKSGISVQLETLKIELTTLDRLPLMAFSNAARIDVDLDFFFMNSFGLTHHPNDVAKVLRNMKLDLNSVAFTYSVSSGFLPADFRWVGSSLAKEIGGELQKTGTRPQKSAAIMDALNSKKLLNLEEINQVVHEANLDMGAQYSAKSILSVNSLGPKEAAVFYDLANKNGDKAIWPAYAIGLHYFEKKKYSEALFWFARVIDTLELSDSLELHSLFLYSICAFRLGHYQLALEACLKHIQLVPIREEIYPIAIASAEKLSNNLEVQTLRDQAEHIKKIRSLRESVVLTN